MLKEILKENKNARRIFGKKEIEIIIKQLDGLPLKQSEMNRLSRDIKPKLEFIKDISRFQDEFKLKKNQDNKRIIQKSVDTILEDGLTKDIEAILLFGSFADKTNIQRSDIDICVLFKNNISLEQATKFRIRISGKLPEKLDIQVFNTLPAKVKRDIARNHKVLFQSPEYNNVEFSIKYLKDDDYFQRLETIFGGAAA